MKASIRLTPTRHAMPVCSSYDDGPEVERFERAMRVYRAHADEFVVSALDGRADGAFRVRSASGGEYVTDIVDASGMRDACTCPDFLSNLLGTCKHLEATRRAIASSRALRAAFAALPRSPRTPTLCVDARGPLALRVAGKPAAPRFRALGVVDAGDTVVADPTPAFGAGFLASGVRVVHAAVPAVAILGRRREHATRAREIQASLQRGALALDVLARPLFPYQKIGVTHLVSAGRALLADDMGLGKTVQTIAACEVLRARGEARKVLIVCPASLKDQWAREIATYAGAQAVVVTGGIHARQSALRSDAPYTILNYELTWRDLGVLQDLGADVLVLDEAQRAKNFRTKTSATLRSIPSRFLFVLTGTPLENRLDDLFGLLQLVDPAVLGPLWKFNLDFHVQTDRAKVIGYRNLSRLRERIAPVVLRRRKEDVLSQLPPLTEQTRYMPLSKEQEQLEGSFRSAAARLMKIAERRALTVTEQRKLLSALLKARQACNGVALCDPESPDRSSSKLDELVSLVAEIGAQGASKILVFSEWTQMLRLAAARLDALGVGHLLLHGGVPTDKRPALIERFRQDPEAVVLLSTDAGGVGLNLQVATYVIHLDLPWNPGRLDQRIARAHRLGQTRGVSVIYLCAASGIERGIEGTLAGKRAVRHAAVDPTSDVDTLDAPSFSVSLRQVQKVMDALADAPSEIGARETATLDATAQVESDAEIATIDLSPATEPESEVASAEPQAPSQSRPVVAVARGSAAFAADRLRLARVVLEAGFPGDAVRAAYDSVAASLRSLAAEPVGEGHAALVATLYRELLPAGKVPATVHATLARMHDLAQLEAHGVALDADLAADAVEHAGEWLARFEAPSHEAASRGADCSTAG